MRLSSIKSSAPHAPDVARVPHAPRPERRNRRALGADMVPGAPRVGQASARIRASALPSAPRTGRSQARWTGGPGTRRGASLAASAVDFDLEGPALRCSEGICVRPHCGRELLRHDAGPRERLMTMISRPTTCMGRRARAPRARHSHLPACGPARRCSVPLASCSPRFPADRRPSRTRRESS